MRQTEKQADPFYGSAAWRRLRRIAMDRDCGLCVMCRDAGRFTHDRKGRRVPVLAEVVHHVRHRDEYPELELDLDNLICLCTRCHDEVHPEKHRAAGKPLKSEKPLPDIAALAGVVKL